MKHNKNTKVMTILAKWCKEHENTMETSHDMARGHLEIVEARAVVQSINVLGDILQEILDMEPDRLDMNYLDALGIKNEIGLSCEMCHGPISVEDHAQCDICPECMEGNDWE